uniref:Uncharacterized protein n=1 Tax=Timema bartmani TaxID=61472 RepID=A0A7R9EQD1_9NEOP|nr:unnamed protein product [Timema bartmani]
MQVNRYLPRTGVILFRGLRQRIRIIVDPTRFDRSQNEKNIQYVKQHGPPEKDDSQSSILKSAFAELMVFIEYSLENKAKTPVFKLIYCKMIEQLRAAPSFVGGQLVGHWNTLGTRTTARLGCASKPSHSGVSVANVCKEYGIAKQTISGIRKNKDELKTFALQCDVEKTVSSRKLLKLPTNNGIFNKIRTEEEIVRDVLSSTFTDQNTGNEEELQPLSKSKLSSAREALDVLIGVINLTSDPELHTFYRHFRTAQISFNIQMTHAKKDFRASSYGFDSLTINSERSNLHSVLSLPFSFAKLPGALCATRTYSTSALGMISFHNITIYTCGIANYFMEGGEDYEDRYSFRYHDVTYDYIKISLLSMFALVGMVMAGRLENTYLPPNNAASSGGAPGAIAAPFSGGAGNFGGSGAGKLGSGRFGVGSGASGANRFGGSVVGGYSGAGASGSYSGSGRFGAGAGGLSSGAAIPILKYDNQNNGDGSYSFSYETANSISQSESGYLKNAGAGEGAEAQTVQGSYSYTGPDGITINLAYTADENGFQAQGDHLPKSPPIPEEILNYETGNGISHEESGFLKDTGDPENQAQVVQGSSSYTSPEGIQIKLVYVADEFGFQPTGDHLPVKPPTPVLIQKALDYLATLPSTPEPPVLPIVPSSIPAGVPQATYRGASGLVNGRDANILILKQANDQIGSGYVYSFETENGIATQETGSLKSFGPKGDAIVAEGVYRYTAPNGVLIETRYSADENGFRAEGAHLPVGPPIPEYILRSLEYIAANPPKPERSSLRQ